MAIERVGLVDLGLEPPSSVTPKRVQCGGAIDLDPLRVRDVPSVRRGPLRLDARCSVAETVTPSTLRRLGRLEPVRGS